MERRGEGRVVRGEGVTRGFLVAKGKSGRKQEGGDDSGVER
jgi:hypothetical protein